MKLTDPHTQQVTEARQYPGLDVEESAQVDELSEKLHAALKKTMKETLEGVPSEVRSWVIDNIDGSTILDIWNS